ncbi:MAG: MATE family efflux transporter, partial [Clostridiales bacterium]|nr:MATE family efflux transporter [Clostridiales bacterium]
MDLTEKDTSPVPQENKMGIMPVNKLLLTMSIPIMISMLVQALYNIVDSIFVAQISENALTAVSLAFPMQNLLIAVGVGTGVGVNALLSKSL